MADETVTTDTGAEDATEGAELLDGAAGDLLPEPPKVEPTAEQKKAAKATKAADARKATAAQRSAKPGKAPDGMAAAEGNRDDAAELDLGARTAVMGALPDQLKADRPETAEEKVTRLERENDALRAGLRSLVPDEARAVLAEQPVARTAAPVRSTAAPIPGEGPALWLGSIDGAPIIPPVLFRGSAIEAEAREQFLKHGGIISTTGKVVVARQKE